MKTVKDIPIIKVSTNDLPLTCPNKGSDPAMMHPRVAIALNSQHKKATCPYCSAHYQLAD